MSDDSVIVRRIDYRVVRPDGAPIWRASYSSHPPPHLPWVDSDGWLHCGTPMDDPFAPPFVFQRLDDGDWTTIETSEG